MDPRNKNKATADEFLLEVRGLGKCFSGVEVLKDIRLGIERGQACALTGENGAGKSTLGKILSGFYSPDSGEILWKGAPVRWRHPQEALHAGVAMIHQELMPFPEMTIAENICMGQEPSGRMPGWIDRAAVDRMARKVLERLGTKLPPKQKVKELSTAEIQIVEIAKALVHRAGMIIMDEPTSALSQREIEVLLGVITDLKTAGMAILYITHKLEEVFRIADSITVLRDGRHIETAAVENWDEGRLISSMVGREVGCCPPEPIPCRDSVALEVRRLTRPGRFQEVSFSLYEGEILGITGLMGAGRTDLLHALFGITPALSGEILLHGRAVQIRNPGEAIAAGMALVGEDRQEYGIVPEMSVKANLTLANLARCCRFGWIDPYRENDFVDKQMRRFDIKTGHRLKKIQYLSGGNQQKVLIARALFTEPSILLADEPTRGIDVGAKEEVYRILTRLALEGKAILLVSSELTEILHLSTRILVMRQGRICAELNPRETSQEKILEHAMPR